MTDRFAEFLKGYLAGRNPGEHPSYGGQAVVVLEGTCRQAIKQLGNAPKGMQPTPAIHAAKQFDFPGVNIFSEASGEATYIAESQCDSQGG